MPIETVGSAAMLGPPEFIYALPPGLVFIVILGAVGVVAVAIYSLLLLPSIRRASSRLIKISTAVGTVSGAIFALSMAFLANAVWSMEDRAREAVNAEARAIQVMDIYMDLMTRPAQDGLTRLLADYGSAVAAEWPNLNFEGRQAEQVLRNIYSAIISGLAEGERNRVLQQRLLSALDNLSAARQQRLSIAQHVVSGSQWTLVAGLGIVLLIVLAMIHADFHLAAKISLCSLTVAISLLLQVIILHDRPFIGYEPIGPGPIITASGATP